jgi:hypothetical protein
MRSRTGQRLDIPALFVADMPRRLRLNCMDHRGKDGGGRKMCLGNYGCATTLKTKIGKVYIRQNEDQGKQKEFKQQQTPSPQFHVSPEFGKKLVHLGMACQ